jgi:hypothetical protein
MTAAVDDERLEVAVGVQALEQGVGEAHVELLLDRERQLEQVEPVDGQVVGERATGGELCRGDADRLGDEAAQAEREVVSDKDAPGRARWRPDARGWSARS